MLINISFIMCAACSSKCGQQPMIAWFAVSLLTQRTSPIQVTSNIRHNLFHLNQFARIPSLEVRPTTY